MAAKKVAFKRLQLRGFGIYRDGIEVLFEPGLNNLVTENERGKSTLVAGLLAILYGLPGKSNPAEFGLGCYRNWDNPSRCDGELEFTVNDEHYFLQRDFDTNRISFWKTTREGKTILAEGVHNPIARRKHPHYEKTLKEIFGLNSKELFESIFCIIQPLPEMKSLSNEVQKLLSGGGVDFAAVQAALEDELKERTRFTGDLGITPRNLQKDKELELLEAEIAAWRRRIEEDREAVDSLEELQRELWELDLQIQNTRKEQQNKRRILEAWSEWKRRRDNYDSAFRQYKTLRESCQKAEKILQEISSSSEYLKAEYPEFEGAAEETAKKLEELSLLEDKKREYEKDLEELQRLLGENLAEKEKLEAELQNFPRWQELGAGPVARVRDTRKNAAALRKEWSTFQAKLKELEKKELFLEKEYNLFQQAQPAELEAVKSYSRRYAEILQAREKANFALESARAKRDSYEKALKAFKEKFFEYEADIPDEEAVHRKLDALERENEGLKKVEALKKKLSPSLVLRLIFASLVAALAGGAAGAANSFLLVAAVIVGALAGYFAAGLVTGMLKTSVKKELQAAEQNLSACREEIAQLDGRLGRFSAASPARLGSLLEIIRQYKEEKAGLEEREKELPGTEEINSLEEECRKAEEEYRTFTALTSKFTALFPHVDEAYNEWQKTLKERDYLVAETEAYARGSFGCDVKDIFKADLRSHESADIWKEVAFFLQIFFPERAPATVQDMIALLDSISDATWEQVEEKAREYDTIVNRIKKIEVASETLESSRREQDDRLAELQDKIEELYRMHSGILDRADGDVRKARERWSARQALLHEIEIKKGKLQTILKQFQVDALEQLEEKKLEGEILLNKRLGEWQGHIENYPGLPGIEESRDAEKIDIRIRALEAEVGQKEVQLEKLQKKQEECKTRLLLLQKRELLNIAHAEIELAALEKKKQELELIRDALVTAYNELSAAVVDYQRSYQRHLQEAASDYYQKITKNTARKIVLDKEFQVQVEEGGRPCDINQLSKGAQDQLYLALRLSIADLIAENLKLPFIFDDPFVSSDSGRLDNIRTILDSTAEERQYAIFSHNSIFSNWGTPVKIINAPSHRQE